MWPFSNKKHKAEIAALKDEVATLIANKEELEGKLVKYSRIISIEDEIVELSKRKREVDADLDKLSQKYAEAHKLYLELKHQNELYTESLDLAEYGVYEPHFDFDMSEWYKVEVENVREEQKKMIKDGAAVFGGETITWNGSLAQGQAMVKREKKLMLRAFNGECDSFIASVEWNNVQKMEERIEKSRDAINSTYKSQGITISRSYKMLKVKELQLAYEYKLKKKEEKEEQRLIREQMREEERVAREIETVKIKAEKEEADAQKAIEKAKKELENSDEKSRLKLEDRIRELEERLREAEQNKERALSMAQQTRRGHVYIISNIGSFGENVYKIGMTRRLEPMDRVRELGDASVPFSFDVHAIIFSEDAPKLEKDLHTAFESRRVNAVNMRKEFFNVTLSEIEDFVKGNEIGKIEFTKVAEAEEYRETLAKKHDLTYANNKKVEEVNFPAELF